MMTLVKHPEQCLAQSKVLPRVTVTSFLWLLECILWGGGTCFIETLCSVLWPSDFCFKGRRYPYPTQLRMYARTCILEALFHCPAAFVEHLLCVWLVGREREVGRMLTQGAADRFLPHPRNLPASLGSQTQTREPTEECGITEPRKCSIQQRS